MRARVCVFVWVMQVLAAPHQVQHLQHQECVCLCVCVCVCVCECVCV